MLRPKYKQKYLNCKKELNDVKTNLSKLQLTQYAYETDYDKLTKAKRVVVLEQIDRYIEYLKDQLVI